MQLSYYDTYGLHLEVLKCWNGIINLKFCFWSAPRSAEIQLKLMKFWIIDYEKKK